MTPYSRGYAAALKAAADVLQKRARGWGARYDTIHNGAAIGDELEWLSGNILSLPIQGEATNAGTNATQPVAESQAPAPSEPGDRGVAPTLADSRPARSGPCVVVPVEELKIVLDFFRKANWPDTRAGNAAYRLNNAMLAAAKEE